MKKIEEILALYLPEAALDDVLTLMDKYPCQVKITRQRVTKHGDFRRYKDGTLRISINADPNPYRFVITMIHEFAHLVTYQERARVRPHGAEWQHNFRLLMLPLLRPDVFPDDILAALAQYLKKPCASTDGDLKLSLALKGFDPKKEVTLIFELPEQSHFQYRNRTFVKGQKRRTRYECTEVATHRKFVFHPHAEVEPIEE